MDAPERIIDKRSNSLPPFGNQRGATVVEFAVIVGLLLVILMGILEFGFIFLQEHFVANAAREGLRVGIRANNFDNDAYNSVTPLPLYPDEECNETTDRKAKVDCVVREYLQTLYPNNETGTVDVVTDTNDAVGPPATRSLTVTVTAQNFFPTLLTGLIPGFNPISEISFTAKGDYEDPVEE